jgi:hypothetical protein
VQEHRRADGCCSQPAEAQVLDATRNFCLTEVLTMGLLLLIIVLVLVFGGLPRWGYHSYGYAPSGIGAVLVIVLIVLLLSGRL